MPVIFLKKGVLRKTQKGRYFVMVGHIDMNVGVF